MFTKLHDSNKKFNFLQVLSFLTKIFLEAKRTGLGLFCNTLQPADFKLKKSAKAGLVRKLSFPA